MSQHAQSSSPHDFDERHATWLAGVEYGQMRANRLAAQAIAQELLSAQAAEMLGLARREAMKKGPAWTALLLGEEGSE